MFAFKARSISEYIADPIASGNTIPTNAVIFMANNDMSTYNSSSNWTFIDMGQSDGTPSHIRGCSSVAGVGLYQRNITDSFTTSTVGAHGDGLSTYQQAFYNFYHSYANRPFSAENKPDAGSHSHSISGLSSSINLGGKYFTSLVVASYKCTSTTKEIPKNAIVFATFPQNEDFIPVDSYEWRYGLNKNLLLISGSSTWLGKNYPYYGGGLETIPLTPTISNSGDHTHTLYGQTGDELELEIRPGYTTTQTNYVNTGGLGGPYHNHDANNMVAFVSTKSIYLKTYKTVRNTSVYKGMILGWTGTNAATLPKGWYICNGQSVNGYITPALNVDAVVRTTGSNIMGQINGTDTATITYAIGGTQGQHSHYTRGAYYSTITVNGSIDNYHSTNYPWNHRHDGPSSPLTFKQASYAINFIIFLG